jgi:hypothetical protein
MKLADLINSEAGDQLVIMVLHNALEVLTGSIRASIADFQENPSARAMADILDAVNDYEKLCHVLDYFGGSPQSIDEQFGLSEIDDEVEEEKPKKKKKSKKK